MKKRGSIAVLLALVLEGWLALPAPAANTTRQTLSTAQVLDVFYSCTEKRPQGFCRDWMYAHFEEIAEGKWVARKVSTDRDRPEISGFDWQQHIRENP